MDNHQSFSDKSTDVLFEIVRNAVTRKYDDLPDHVIEITKMFILDTIGTAFAGSTATGSKDLFGLVSEQGGKEESTIWVFGKKVPSQAAAFVNGVMAHARDFDDTHDEAVFHAHTSVLPASLALAERQNKGGKKLITAVVLGVDFFCRLGLALPSLGGWIHSSTLAYFASTLAAAKILSFDEDQCLNALGIAYSQVSGNRQCLEERTLTKRVQPGLGSRAGVFSALLAERNITGPKNVLHGKYGFVNLYQKGNCDKQKMSNGLGESYGVEGLSMKPWPSCRGTHGAIDLILQFVQENAITEEEIERITFYVPQLVYDLTGRAFKIGTNPQVDAQFSIPYTTATSIIKKELTLLDFEDETVINSPALNLTERITVLVDRDIKDPKALVPIKMKLIKKNGEVITKETNFIKGCPNKRMNVEECVQKFSSCVEYSSKPYLIRNVDNIVHNIMNLQELDDLTQLIDLLS